MTLKTSADRRRHARSRIAVLPGDLLEPLLRSISGAIADGTAPHVEAWTALLVLQVANSTIEDLGPLVKDQRLSNQIADQIEELAKRDGRFEQVVQRASRVFSQADVRARLERERDPFARWRAGGH